MLLVMNEDGKVFMCGLVSHIGILCPIVGTPTVRLPTLTRFSWYSGTHIWKARSVVIFEQLTMSPNDVLRCIVKDMDSWRQRYMQHYWDVWQNFINSCV